MVWIKQTANEYRTGTSHHICDTCKTEFTVIPAVDKSSHAFDNCLDDDCASYDPDRDCEILFMSDEEIRDEKKIVSIEMLRKRATKIK